MLQQRVSAVPETKDFAFEVSELTGATLTTCDRRLLTVPMEFLVGTPDLETLIPAVEDVLAVLLPASNLLLVNVNLPAETPRGLCWTRQSVRHYDGEVVPGRDPMGRSHFWFVVKKLEAAEDGTDRWAVEHGYVSMTPLRLDLTHDEQLQTALETMPVRKARDTTSASPRAKQ